MAGLGGAVIPASARGEEEQATLAVTATVVESCRATVSSADEPAAPDAAPSKRPAMASVVCNGGAAGAVAQETVETVYGPEIDRPASSPRNPRWTMPAQGDPRSGPAEPPRYRIVTITY